MSSAPAAPIRRLLIGEPLPSAGGLVRDGDRVEVDREGHVRGRAGRCGLGVGHVLLVGRLGGGLVDVRRGLLGGLTEEAQQVEGTVVPVAADPVPSHGARVSRFAGAEVVNVLSEKQFSSVSVVSPVFSRSTVLTAMSATAELSITLPTCGSRTGSR